MIEEYRRLVKSQSHRAATLISGTKLAGKGITTIRRAPAARPFQSKIRPASSARTVSPQLKERQALVVGRNCRHTFLKVDLTGPVSKISSKVSPAGLVVIF